MSSETAPTPVTILDSTGHVAADLKCFNCAYDLRTQPVTSRCPECGHPVAETAVGYLPQLDREGRVAGDLPCVSCEYNLRTQPATGLRSQCASPVARSVARPGPDGPSPAWASSPRCAPAAARERWCRSP
ncbi:MAG: hypothetical protein ACE5I3_14300 [Phycisphaerae bacterium]